MTPSLVIFDCDGVLVDTETVVAQVVSNNLADHGLTLAAHEVHHLFIGGTMQDAEREALARGAALPDLWLPEIYAAIFERLSEGVDVVDGIPDLLDALDAASIAMCVASNGPMEKMRISLGPSGLWDRFGGDGAGRILSREQHKPKPDPAMIHHAMALFDAAPERTVLIDDSPAGCQAGLNAGISCIGFDAYGQSDRLTPLGIPLAKDMAEVRHLIFG